MTHGGAHGGTVQEVGEEQLSSWFPTLTMQCPLTMSRYVCDDCLNGCAGMKLFCFLINN